MIKKLSFAFVFFFSWALVQGQAPTKAYFIGHSLCSVDMPKILSDLAADGGHAYQYDYQLIWGACLSKQWDNHMNPSVGTDSRAQLATGDYDVLIMMEGVPLDEVIYGPGWGCNYPTRNVGGWFYDLARNANPDLKGFIIEPWNEFNRNSPDYYQEWLDTNAVQAPLFQDVLDSIAWQYPQHDRMCLVPLRQCFEALTDSIWAGAVPGLTHMFDIFDLAADTIPEHTFHVNALGHYYSALVHYTAIFGVSPVGLTHQTYDLGGNPYPAPTPAMALKMQEIVWEVYAGFQTCLVTDREEGQPAKAELKVYPNPSEGRVRISWSSEGNPVGQASTLSIFDQTGREVRHLQAPFQKGNVLELDLSDLGAGVYFLKVGSDAGQVVEKLILAP